MVNDVPSSRSKQREKMDRAMDRWIEVLDGSMDRAMDRMDRGSERVLDKNLELGQPKIITQNKGMTSLKNWDFCL